MAGVVVVVVVVVVVGVVVIVGVWWLDYKNNTCILFLHA